MRTSLIEWFGIVGGTLVLVAIWQLFQILSQLAVLTEHMDNRLERIAELLQKGR
jgi:hypothetical protein